MENFKNRFGGQKVRLIPLGIFLIFLVCIILTFFACVYRDIEKNAKETIMGNVEHQNQNFQNIINQHFQYLEGLADYIGIQAELRNTHNLKLLDAISEKSSMDWIAVVGPDGTSTYTEGQMGAIIPSAHFQAAMKGERALSRPVESQADGQLRIILAVPIFHGSKVIGVLEGSCNLSLLGQMLLADIYSGSGYILIVSADGSIITQENDESGMLSSGRNLFDTLAEADFTKEKSHEQVVSDFSAQNSDITSFTYEKNSYYIAYKPLGMADWLLCYIAPKSIAQQPYQFIMQYGLILLAALIAGIAVLLVVIFRANIRTQSELLKMGQSDALTGLLNKQSTETMIQKWLEDDQRSGLQAMLMMDVDDFKNVNDTYGHAAGDVILHDIGELIRHEFREGDILGRVGGDEFCVMMKNVGSEANAVAKVERLREHIHEHVFKETEVIDISCSIGLAFSPTHGNSFSELYRTADTALYETKRRGGDGYSVFKG